MYCCLPSIHDVAHRILVRVGATIERWWVCFPHGRRHARRSRCRMNAVDMKVGGLYNWKSDTGSMLVYIGKQGTWHQFALASSPGTVWCEVLDCDLRLLEEATLDSVIALVRGYLDARDEYERLTAPPNSHAQPRLPHGHPATKRFVEGRVALRSLVRGMSR